MEALSQESLRESSVANEHFFGRHIILEMVMCTLLNAIWVFWGSSEINGLRQLKVTLGDLRWLWATQGDFGRF